MPCITLWCFIFLCRLHCNNIMELRTVQNHLQWAMLCMSNPCCAKNRNKHRMDGDSLWIRSPSGSLIHRDDPLKRY